MPYWISGSLISSRFFFRGDQFCLYSRNTQAFGIWVNSDDITNYSYSASFPPEEASFSQSAISLSTQPSIFFCNSRSYDRYSPIVKTTQDRTHYIILCCGFLCPTCQGIPLSPFRVDSGTDQPQLRRIPKAALLNTPYYIYSIAVSNSDGFR